MADMPVPSPADRLSVVLVYSPGPRQTLEQPLELLPDATVADALAASGVLQRCPELRAASLDVGVWGQPATLGQLLQPLDRVEIYRPLKVDPKTARRERFRQQGARGAGLFARRRPGAKPGY